MTTKTTHQQEADLRATLTALAERWQQLADSAPKHPEYLYIDPLTPIQRDQNARGAAYAKAAADLRDVLATGHIPHDLMTDAELDQYGPRGEERRIEETQL